MSRQVEGDEANQQVEVLELAEADREEQLQEEDAAVQVELAQSLVGVPRRLLEEVVVEAAGVAEEGQEAQELQLPGVEGLQADLEEEEGQAEDNEGGLAVGGQGQPVNADLGEEGVDHEGGAEEEGVGRVEAGQVTGRAELEVEQLLRVRGWRTAARC